MMHVFGLGECGSRIALDLFEQLCPHDKIELETKPSKEEGLWSRAAGAIRKAFVDAGLSVDLSRVEVGFAIAGIQISLKPHIFIGDLNKGNTSYRTYLAAQKILDFVAEQPRSPGGEVELSNELKEECRRALEKESLFDERVVFDQLYDLVVRRQRNERIITLLRFIEAKPANDEGQSAVGTASSRESRRESAGEGAGGNQIYSELLAAKYELHNRIKSGDREENVLVGIFSIGGGTGAGSGTAIFRKLGRQSQYAYSMGIAILPTWTDRELRARAGRFLTRYIRLDEAERARGLILVSNQAADYAVKLVDADASPEGVSSLAAVNQFSLNSLKAVFLTRATALKTIEGKQFDFRDFSTWMSGVTAMGYTSVPVGAKGEIALWPAIIDAISPMAMETRETGPRALKGLSVCVTSDELSPHQAIAEIGGIRETLANAARALASAKGPDGEEEAVREVRELGDNNVFYGTIKRCTFFVFIPEQAQRMVKTAYIKDWLRKLLTALTGADNQIDVSWNVYSVAGLERIEILAFPSDGLIPEVPSSVFNFVAKAFVAPGNADQVEACRNFVGMGWDHIRSIFEGEVDPHSSAAEEFDTGLREMADQLNQEEQLFKGMEALMPDDMDGASELRMAPAGLADVLKWLRLRAAPTLQIKTAMPKFGRRRTRVQDEDERGQGDKPASSDKGVGRAPKRKKPSRS